LARFDAAGIHQTSSGWHLERLAPEEVRQPDGGPERGVGKDARRQPGDDGQAPRTARSTRQV